MGRQKHIQLQGTFGNIIYYQRWGEGYMRTKPGKVQQTAATRRAFAAFGKAVSISRVIRKELKPVIPLIPGKAQQYIVDNAIRKWLATESINSIQPLEKLPFINSLEFNPACEILPRLHLHMEVYLVNDHLELHIPSFSPLKCISAPASTMRVGWKVMATSVCLDTLQAAPTPIAEWVINYSDPAIPANTIELPFVLSPAHVALLVLNITFLKNKDVLQQGAAVLWSGWVVG